METTAAKIKTALNLRYKPTIFNSKEGAFRWADRCVKPHTVILGDNQKFWIVCFADASRLHKAGYEYAK